MRTFRFLLCASALGLSIACHAEPEAFLIRPDIHGNRVVFTAEGDLWLADITTGDAWRITSDPGNETSAHFSPDGKQIAFTANYDGYNDVYVMPAEGGTPKRLTYEPTDDSLMGATVLGWTPDGRNILFNSASKLGAPRFEQETTEELFSVPASGGMPVRLSVPRASYASLNTNGKLLAYVPTSSWMNWFRYEGGEADQVWMTELGTGKFSELTHEKGINTQPVWCGTDLYFVSERSGVRNLWKLNPQTRQAKQITFSKAEPVRFPSSDGARIVFQLGPKLEIFDPAHGGERPLEIHLHSDRIHARPFQISVADAAKKVRNPTGCSLDPSGKRIAISPRGQLLTVPVEEGVTHRLVNDSSQRVQNPAWSPDGKQIAYVSDASGEEQLYLIEDNEGATPIQLTHSLTGQHGSPIWSPDGKRLILGNRTGDIQLIDVPSGSVRTIAHNLGENSGYAIQQDCVFSPDSKWIAYSISLGWRLGTVFLYEIASGKATQVSDSNIDSGSPAFSRDGRYLFMIQGRTISQTWTLITARMNHVYSNNVTGFALSSDLSKPWENASEASGASTTKVDLEGLANRSFDLGVAPGNLSGLLSIPGKLLVQADSGVIVCDLSTGKSTTVTPNMQMIEASADGKRILDRGKGGLSVFGPEGGPIGSGDGSIKLDDLMLTVDPQKEWRQIFEESWRVTRDIFYDPNMLGMDWRAIGDRYRKRLPLVSCRYDLLLLQRDMISELNTGHSFAGMRPEFPAKNPGPACLGVDLTWDAAAGAYQISHILNGNAWNLDVRSPFREPGVQVKEGEYLLKIAGVALRRDEDPAALLVGMAGRVIEVTVNSKASLSGARNVKVKPLGNERDLRQTDWVESRRAYVTKMSGGQLAYVYLSDLGSRGATEFAQQYYPNVNKAGIIIDVRGNDGGNISGSLLNDLSSRITGFFAYRAGGNYRREGWAPLGRVVAITNEWAFSDGDYFSENFKRLKIGPLVGHRTTGGLVGPVIYDLMDGGIVGVPNYGAWMPGEWLVEGRGVVPDYEVDQDQAAVMAGHDPQLEKAVELLLTDLKAHPFKIPEHPPYPKKLGGSRGD